MALTYQNFAVYDGARWFGNTGYGITDTTTMYSGDYWSDGTYNYMVQPAVGALQSSSTELRIFRAATADLQAASPMLTMTSSPWFEVLSNSDSANNFPCYYLRYGNYIHHFGVGYAPSPGLTRCWAITVNWSTGTTISNIATPTIDLSTYTSTQEAIHPTATLGSQGVPCCPVFDDTYSYCLFAFPSNTDKLMGVDYSRMDYAWFDLASSPQTASSVSAADNGGYGHWHQVSASFVKNTDGILRIFLQRTPVAGTSDDEVRVVTLDINSPITASVSTTWGGSPNHSPHIPGCTFIDTIGVPINSPNSFEEVGCRTLLRYTRPIINEGALHQDYLRRILGSVQSFSWIKRTGTYSFEVVHVERYDRDGWTSTEDMERTLPFITKSTISDFRDGWVSHAHADGYSPSLHYHNNLPLYEQPSPHADVLHGLTHIYHDTVNGKFIIVAAVTDGPLYRSKSEFWLISCDEDMTNESMYGDGPLDGSPQGRMNPGIDAEIVGTALDSSPAYNYWTASGSISAGGPLYLHIANQSLTTIDGNYVIPIIASRTAVSGTGGQAYGIYAEIVLGSASSDTTVTGIPDSLVLTEQTASISLDVTVTGTVDTLAITEQTATITLGVNVVGIADTLAITEQTASLALDRTVTGSAQALAITEQPASIALDITISGSAQAIAITEQTAAIALDATVTGSPHALVITEQPGTVSLDVTITGSTQALVLTEQTATITYNADTEVTGIADSLVLTEQTASVALDVTITGSAQALVLTEQTATLAYDVTVTGATDSLVLTEQTATFVYDVTVTGTPASLALTEQTASVSLGINVAGTPDSLALTEQTATLVYDRTVTGVIDTLAITEDAALISLDRTVTGIADALAITEATAALSLDRLVTGVIDALNITEGSATFVYDVSVSGLADSLVLTEQTATVDLNTLPTISNWTPAGGKSDTQTGTALSGFNFGT